MNVQEIKMKAAGALRYEKRITKAKETNSYGKQSAAGRSLVAIMMQRASESLQADLDSHDPGVKQKINSLLRTLDIKEACAVGATVLVNHTISNNTSIHMKSVIRAIGKAIYEEVYFAAFKDEFGPAFLEVIIQRNKDDMFGTRKLKTFIKSRVGNTDFEEWTLGQQIQVGAKIMTHLMASGEYFEEHRYTKGKRKHVIILPTEKLIEKLRETDNRVAMSEIICGPTLKAPIPWTSLVEGGYETILRPLVKGAKGERLANLQENHMPEVFDAVNRLQSVPLRLARDVYETARYFFEHEMDFMIEGMPARDMGEPPAFPERFNGKKRRELPEEDLPEWDRAIDARREFYSLERKNRSRVLSLHSILAMAEDLKDEGEFFTPVQLDFRGRVYCLSQFNYQGNKLMRSLIEFAEGAPIGEGADAYMIHGANVWGLDKLPMSERIQWVKDNRDWIISIWDDPIENFHQAREAERRPHHRRSYGWDLGRCSRTVAVPRLGT